MVIEIAGVVYSRLNHCHADSFFCSTDLGMDMAIYRRVYMYNYIFKILGLGIGCNFMIDNQLQPTDQLSIIISSSHFCSNWVLEV